MRVGSDWSEAAEIGVWRPGARVSPDGAASGMQHARSRFIRPRLRPRLDPPRSDQSRSVSDRPRSGISQPRSSSQNALPGRLRIISSTLSRGITPQRSAHSS